MAEESNTVYAVFDYSRLRGLFSTKQKAVDYINSQHCTWLYRIKEVELK